MSGNAYASTNALAGFFRIFVCKEWKDTLSLFTSAINPIYSADVLKDSTRQDEPERARFTRPGGTDSIQGKNNKGRVLPDSEPHKFQHEGGGLASGMI